MGELSYRSAQRDAPGRAPSIPKRPGSTGSVSAISSGKPQWENSGPEHSLGREVDVDGRLGVDHREESPVRLFPHEVAESPRLDHLLPAPRILDHGVEALRADPILRASFVDAAQDELIADIDIEVPVGSKEPLQILRRDEIEVGRLQVEPQPLVLAEPLQVLGGLPRLEDPHVGEELHAHPVESHAARDIGELRRYPFAGRRDDGVPDGVARRVREGSGIVEHRLDDPFRRVGEAPPLVLPRLAALELPLRQTYQHGAAQEQRGHEQEHAQDDHRDRTPLAHRAPGSGNGCPPKGAAIWTGRALRGDRRTVAWIPPARPSSPAKSSSPTSSKGPMVVSSTVGSGSRRRKEIATNRPRRSTTSVSASRPSSQGISTRSLAACAAIGRSQKGGRTRSAAPPQRLVELEQPAWSPPPPRPNGPPAAARADESEQDDQTEHGDDDEGNQDLDEGEAGLSGAGGVLVEHIAPTPHQLVPARDELQGAFPGSPGSSRGEHDATQGDEERRTGDEQSDEHVQEHRSTGSTQAPVSPPPTRRCPCRCPRLPPCRRRRRSGCRMVGRTDRATCTRSPCPTGPRGASLSRYGPSQPEGTDWRMGFSHRAWRPCCVVGYRSQSRK